MPRLNLLSALTATLLLALCSCAAQTPAAKAPTSAVDDALPGRIAEGLAKLSPPADLSDPGARDAAGDRLSRFEPLLNAAGDRILWGGFDPTKGYDPEAYTLTEFVPMVWAKMYLSTFTFPGPYQVRQEGKFRVAEVAAKFRNGLDSGDYPYPFWHSAKKWQAYVDAEALLLVFDRDRLIAAFRKAAPTTTVVEKPWDGRWRWTDEKGAEQPRVALYSYLFSKDNPEVANLETRYRKMEQAFREESCTSCHTPDNPAKANPLLLLNFPNQALAGRHLLVKILRDNEMPPADEKKGVKAGIHDEATREKLIELAKEFETAADAALAYEKKTAPTGANVP
jgi:mono/diheme cytochrome c family protein